MNGMKSFIGDILDSYEKRVQVVCKAMKGVAGHLKHLSEEQADMVIKVRDILAKRRSLRKRDFDSFLEDVVAKNLEKEKKVTRILEDFQKEQKKMICRLKGILAGEERILPDEFGSVSKEILGRLNKMEKEASNMLRSFHVEQRELSAGLRRLVQKGEEVKIKDVKVVTEGIRLRQQERETDVGRLLNDLDGVSNEINLEWQGIITSYI